MYRILFSLLLTGFALSNIYAQDGLTIVAVGEAELSKQKVFIPATLVKGTQSVRRKLISKQAAKILREDFNFYRKRFDIQGEGDLSFNATSIDHWVQKGGDYLISLTLDDTKQSTTSGNPLKKEFLLVATVHDLKSKLKILRKEVLFSRRELRGKMHSMADSIFSKITGKPSVFKTKIVFVSDRDSRKGKVIKELYLMDFDGKNKRRITKHREVVVSPAINFDGSKVLYSVIHKTGRIRNVDLNIIDLNKRKSMLLSARKGINSGAVFIPNSDDILLSLSFTGNTEIYRMNMKSRKLKRLTKHYSEDVDPSLSSDGKTMTFLSGRSGKAMIYTMDISKMEKNVKRISYVGRFNAAPRFAPNGDEIVFSSWSEQQQFDLYRINKSGAELVRLTKNFGSNEEPSYSIDGQFIAFGSLRVLSNKRANQNIYIMDREGEIVKQITSNFGKCTSPRWSK